MRTTEATFLKCKCDHCEASLEFEVPHAGEIISCPVCGSETTLRLPLVQPPILPPIDETRRAATKSFWAREERIAKRVAESQAPPAGRAPTPWLAGILCLIGIGLALVGCSSEFEESKRETGSAIRQIYYAVQYCSGFIMIALGAILNVLQSRAGGK